MYVFIYIYVYTYAYLCNYGNVSNLHSFTFNIHIPNKVDSANALFRYKKQDNRNRRISLGAKPRVMNNGLGSCSQKA